MIKLGERIDDLQRQGLCIIQNSSSFCFSIDAVLLAHFAGVRPGNRVVDLGTGTGVIPLLLSTRARELRITGLELVEDVTDMARRSVELNGLTEQIEVLQGDIRGVRETFPVGRYDLVTSNPPYMTVGSGDLSPQDTRKLARHEVACTLKDVVMAASWLLRTGGKFAMVHRPERLPEIMTVLSAYRLEAKRMRLVHPLPGRSANMVLLEAMRNGKPGLHVEPPVYVHKSNGEYTEEILELYAGGALR